MSSKSCLDLEDDLSETFLLYWLDADINKSDHNKTVQKQLRSIVKHLKTFDDQNQCQTIIQSLNEQDRLILIVSGRFGREIVPQIHQFQQISSIYVYCQDKSVHEEWAKHFFKVRQVIVDLDQLITEIKLAHRSRIKFEQLSISYNIYKIIEYQKTSASMLNDNFIQSFMLINILLRLESNINNDDDKQEFICFCKKDYKGQKNQLNIIDEFNDTYKSDKALWWYTRNSFFYQTMDKILRSTTQYFEQLLLSRSFINDIYEELKRNQCKSLVHVYFGQFMWSGEIEHLQNNGSRYLSINKFWLTNINRNKIVDILNNTEKSSEEHKVLFIIDADPNIVTTKPFADISKSCYFDEEEGGEILFMIGSIFRIIEVKKDEDIWFVHLQLCGDNEDDLKVFYESIKMIDENDKINFQTFGNILYRMEQYDLAERFYQQLLNKSSSNDSICSDLYFSLGATAKYKKEYDSSLKLYEKSLKIKLRTDPSDFITIGKLYGCMGEIHRLKTNDKEALKYFEKAIEIYTKEHAEYHQHMADFYDNAASICRRLKRNEEALDYCKKALAVDERQPTSNSHGIAKSHTNIGIVYYLLKHYDLALAHYQKSLAIKLDALPSLHLSIANSYGNIASVYKIMNDLENALVYYQKAETIYQHLLPPQHQDVIQTHNEIQSITDRLKQFF